MACFIYLDHKYYGRGNRSDVYIYHMQGGVNERRGGVVEKGGREKG